MQLAKVLAGLPVIGDYPHDLEISSVELNSAKLQAGALFIAINGKNADGRQYIPDALQKGATAVVFAGDYTPPAGSKAVFVRLEGDMRCHAAAIAANFYPVQPRYVSAVTGTNGKTSIADFTRQIMTFLGHKSASIGTIGLICEGFDKVETLTTPDTVTLHRMLSDLAARGVEYVSMEASSIGIEQYRLDGLQIQVAGFTNLTQDHLDYHLTMQNYLQAKEQLFSRVVMANGAAVLNADIAEYAQLAAVCAERGLRVISYGRNGADLHLSGRDVHATGQTLHLQLFGRNYAVELPLIGEFQAMNVLCAMGMVAAMVGFDEKILSYIPQIKGAPGRLDLAGKLANGAAVYVDYAHTPDALENVLKTARAHTRGKLWVVFGCGGDRDKLKRPIMGKIAADLADEVIVTDDNPRTENPDVIRSEILVACQKAHNIGDRISAIKTAISGLQAGDVLILAGKGHESGQKIGDKIIPMNDIDEARKAIAELK